MNFLISNLLFGHSTKILKLDQLTVNKIPICMFVVEKKPIYTPILTWETAVRKVPWGIIMLLGGGFALAEASKV